MHKFNAEQFMSDMRDFLSLCKRELGLDRLPKIEWVTSQRGMEDRTFGRFVHQTQTIYVMIRGRHPLDIMRTLAHELVHYRQFLEDRLNHTSGKTGSDEENQANSWAGIIMRHFDHAYPEVFTRKPLP